MVPMPDEKSFECASFSVERKRVVTNYYILALSMPAWFVFIPLSAYPLLYFTRGPIRRYFRRRKGLCLKCAYNLTGNTTGICPECGTPMK